ncbi:MAG TPA: oxidoreductase [Acidimicrobiaceae bacterium]|nr:oxidoreductase [Acidimicrobiaceae bacterium]
MTTQQPIHSPFDASSTAAEVIDGIDLQGRFAVVTGGYSGLGLETVRALAGAGCDVVVPARRPEHALEVVDEALGGLDGTVSVTAMDLADLDSVSAFVAELVGAGRPVDICIDNAAIMACPEARVGPGWESQFGTNHLGHFAMTVGLWPLLADGGARVVVLSSTGHKLSDIRWDDIHFEDGYDKWLAYGQAKTANALFAVHLDRLGADHDVRAFAVHPGGIMTELQRHLPVEEMRERGWIDEDGAVNPLFKSPEQGAATSVWAATSPLLADEGGVYCEDCNISSITDPENPAARFLGVDPHAVDAGTAERLWAYSVEVTGVDLR